MYCMSHIIVPIMMNTFDAKNGLHFSLAIIQKQKHLYLYTFFFILLVENKVEISFLLFVYVCVHYTDRILLNHI